MNISPIRFANDLKRHVYESTLEWASCIDIPEVELNIIEHGKMLAENVYEWPDKFNYKKARYDLDCILACLMYREDRPTLDELLCKWLSNICRDIWEEYLYVSQDHAKEWDTPKWWEKFKFPPGFTISEVGENDEYDMPDHAFPGAEFVIHIDHAFFHCDD